MKLFYLTLFWALCHALHLEQSYAKMMFIYTLLIALPVLTLAQTTQDPLTEIAQALFLETDYNKDGQIDRSEIDTNFRDYDTNGDGRISRHEYITYVEGHTTDQALINISHSLYDVYDVDGDHHLDKHDLDNFYSLLDGNANGIVSQEEFVRYWRVLLQDLVNQHGR
ncbi:hypothetical protein Btru_076212 [Bulinus truncatus]|nr:hypothetical protein Btru_076212 [Bulinus truncatus]